MVSCSRLRPVAEKAWGVWVIQRLILIFMAILWILSGRLIATSRFFDHPPFKTRPHGGLILGKVVPREWIDSFLLWGRCHRSGY
jgi:hypothetical protein